MIKFPTVMSELCFNSVAILYHYKGMAVYTMGVLSKCIADNGCQ